MSNVNDPARASEGPPPKDATNMAMLAYVLGIFFPLLGPLLIWLMKKDENAFIADQSKEALNWGITMGICYVVCAILTAVVIAMTFRLIPVLEGRALPWPRLRAVAFWALTAGVLLRTAETLLGFGWVSPAPAVALSGVFVWAAILCAGANLLGAVVRRPG